jgi:protein TonB
MTNSRKHAVSGLVMLLGSSAVFAALYLMNGKGGAPPELDKQDAVAFDVERKPPKKQQIRQRQQQRRPQKSAAAKLAPTPNLGSALAGISFDLPGFDPADLGNAGQDLLGGEASKNMVMTEDAVDKKPVPRKQSAPEFPAKARQRGIQGFVKLNLFINDEGAVEKVRVLEAEPQGVFEESAIAAAQAWEFEPAEYNGNAVTGWFKRTVSFRLN